MIFGPFCAAMFVYVWFLIPETKGTHCLLSLVLTTRDD